MGVRMKRMNGGCRRGSHRGAGCLGGALYGSRRRSSAASPSFAASPLLNLFQKALNPFFSDSASHFREAFPLAALDAVFAALANLCPELHSDLPGAIAAAVSIFPKVFVHATPRLWGDPLHSPVPPRAHHYVVHARRRRPTAAPAHCPPASDSPNPAEGGVASRASASAAAV